jgi:uncharacterized protein
MRWTWMGSGRWSHTFEGKEAVVNGLFAAVIEHRGRNATPDGRPYDNKYCWVCRFADGRLRELREYMDTQLVTETFGADA